MIRLREDYVEDIFIQSQNNQITPNNLPETGQRANTSSSKEGPSKGETLDVEMKISDNNEILLKKSRQARHGKPIW